MVANGRTDDLTQAAEPEIYLSLVAGHRVFEAPGDPNGGGPAIHDGGGATRTARGRSDRRGREPKTLEQIRGDSLASRTFAMQLLVGFSLVGSVLTLVGIYGVLALSVASRRREWPFARRSAPSSRTFATWSSARDSV